MSADPARSPRARSVVYFVVGVVVVPAVVWAVGVVIEQVLLVAAAGAVAAAALRFMPPAEDPGWPDPPEADRDRGARRDVSRLSWSTSGNQEIGAFSLRRVRMIGERRLARRGLDLLDPADRGPIEALIGSGPYRTLTGDHTQAVNGRVFAATMAALEALDPTDQPLTGRAARTGRPTPDDTRTEGAA